MAIWKDPTGLVFHRLTVIRETESRYRKCASGKQRERMVMCRCECGKETEVFWCNLKTGHTQSCGCHAAAVLAAGIQRTHGASETREFSIWCGIKKRCLSEKCHAYRHYGGRGITICDRWKDSFENFLSDMGKVPEKGSIERINNDGNYEPGNCRWATQREQCNNRRSSHWIEHNGQKKTVIQWERELGFNEGQIWARIARGWDFSRAISTPMRKGNYSRLATG